MAHEIWGDRVFVGRGIPAWHKLGKVIQGVATWQEAIKLAGLDWSVEKQSLYDGYGSKVPAWGIFRDIDNAFLGVVGDKYRTIQNEDAFAWVDALIGQEGAHYDSAGALNGGQTIFCAAYLPSAGYEVVPGDHHQAYLMFTTSHDGSESAQAKLTTVRVVCNNTLNAAITGTGERIAVRHTKAAESKLTLAKSLMNNSIRTTEGLRDKMRLLAKRKVTRESATAIFDKLFPALPETQNAAIRNRNIAEVLQCFDFNDGNQFPEVRGTAYNMVNAVTEWTDKARGTRNAKGEQYHDTDKSRILSAMFGSGDRLKQKAVEVIYREAAAMPSIGSVYHSIPHHIDMTDTHRKLFEMVAIN